MINRFIRLCTAPARPSTIPRGCTPSPRRCTAPPPNECTLACSECTVAPVPCTLARDARTLARSECTPAARVRSAGTRTIRGETYASRPNLRAPIYQNPGCRGPTSPYARNVTPRNPKVPTLARPPALQSCQEVPASRVRRAPTTCVAAARPPRRATRRNPRGIRVDDRHAHRKVDRWRRDALRQARSSQPSPAADRLVAGAGTAMPPALGPGACSPPSPLIGEVRAPTRRRHHPDRRSLPGSPHPGRSQEALRLTEPSPQRQRIAARR